MPTRSHKLTLRLTRALFLCFAGALASWPAHSVGLLQGELPPSWSLPDGYNTFFSPQHFLGKVVFINHVNPDDPDLNGPLTDAVKLAVEEGSIDKLFFQGLGIADCKSSWKPNALIRAIGRSRAKRYHSVILFDYAGQVRALWELPEKNSTIIILDKNGICRFIAKGRVSPGAIPHAINLIRSLQ